MSLASMEALLHGLDEAAGQPILLTGAGDAFCAGLNLKEVASLEARGMREFLACLDRLVERLFGYRGPVVAWVNGHAIAGGSVLALCCDHAVASDDAALRIGLNETALGLPFPPKVLAMVRATVPSHALDRVVLGAELHAPREALALGLVDEVSSDARAVAVARLATLSAHPPSIYAYTKNILRGSALRLPPGAQSAFEADVEPLWTSPETKARIQARLARK
jgi:enoyl-CoA hydratase/carnithine racemase